MVNESSFENMEKQSLLFKKNYEMEKQIKTMKWKNKKLNKLL
jgi:hypothetical protein